MANDDNKNAPYVENYPALEEWLDRQRAVQLWCAPVMTADSLKTVRMVSAQKVHGRVFIVTVEADQRGWDIYTGVDSAQIVDTFLDAEERLGLGPKIGNH